MGVGIGCAAAFPHAAAGRVFGIGSDARRGWNLWRRIVRRDPTHARNRPAHGAGRAEAERTGAGDRTRDEAGADGRGPRCGRVPGPDAAPAESALRNYTD